MGELDGSPWFNFILYWVSILAIVAAIGVIGSVGHDSTAERRKDNKAGVSFSRMPIAERGGAGKVLRKKVTLDAALDDAGRSSHFGKILDAFGLRMPARIAL